MVFNKWNHSVQQAYEPRKYIQGAPNATNSVALVSLIMKNYTLFVVINPRRTPWCYDDPAA